MKIHNGGEMRALFRLVFVSHTQSDGGKASPIVGKKKERRKGPKKERKAERKDERERNTV